MGIVVAIVMTRIDMVRMVLVVVLVVVPVELQQ